MKTCRRNVLILAFAICLPSAFFGQPVQERLDPLLRDKFKADGPEGTALVVKEGEVICRKAFGKSNLEPDVVMKPEDVFRIGPISKHFTAYARLKLAAEGKLNLQVDITKYTEHHPDPGHPIALEQLINHPSGTNGVTEMETITPEWMKPEH